MLGNGPYGVRFIVAAAVVVCVAAWVPGTGAVELATPGAVSQERIEVGGVPSVAAAEWKIFRGDAAMRGVATGSLSSKPTLLWSFKTEGPVKSSAVIAETPATKGEPTLRRVYIGSNDGHLYCLDFETGKLVWKFKAEDAIEAPPVTDGVFVLVGSIDAHLYCLDAETGKKSWSYETGDKIVGAAAIAQAAPGAARIVIVGAFDSTLHAVDLRFGKAVWKYDMANPVNGAPAITGGVAYFGGCDGIIHAVGIADGKEVRSVEVGSMIGSTVALAGGTAYVGHMGNEFVAADMAKGAVLWRYKDKNLGYISSAAVDEQRVIFGGKDKRLHCLSRTDGKEIWSLATRKAVDSSPVICGDKVVVGSSDGRVYLVNLSDGKELWSYETGKDVTSSAAVAGGVIVIGSEDGTVYAFDARGK